MSKVSTAFRCSPIWLLIASGLTLVYVLGMPPVVHTVATGFHTGVIERWIWSPFSQRVLVPYLLDLFVHPNDVMGINYAIMFLTPFVMTAALMVLHRYLRDWLSDEQAIIGLLLAAFLQPVLFLFFYLYSVNIPVEMLFITGGLLALKRERYLLYALLVFVGGFNRETTGAYMVAVFVLFTAIKTARTRKWFVVNTLLFLAVFVGIRMAIRIHSWFMDGTPFALPFNLTRILLPAGAYNIPILIMALTTFAAAHYAPRRLRPLRWFWLVNYAVAYTFGVFDEPRLLTAGLFVTMPIVVTGLMGMMKNESGKAALPA